MLYQDYKNGRKIISTNISTPARKAIRGGLINKRKTEDN
jgi:hypothetical protein